MRNPRARERRRHPRASIHMEAVLQGNTPEEDIRLTVLNFSAGGFFCESSRPIQPMTLLGITFQFPPYAEHPPRTIEGRAVVVRCETATPGEKATSGRESCRVGACFTELSADARRHIEGYVEWHNLIYRDAAAAPEATRAA